MKLSDVFSAAALVAACVSTVPTQVEAGSLQVLGTEIRNSRQLSRRASGSRRLGLAHAKTHHSRKSLDGDDSVPQLQRRKKSKRSCKPKTTSGADKTAGTHPQPTQTTGDTTATHTPDTGHGHNNGTSASSCFPALNFDMPSDVPKSTDGWWCDPKDEVAFMGFSYAVSDCPDLRRMTKSFKRMRTEFKSRYVRPYGSCDNDGFHDDMVNAAWEAGVGIYPLIWFGFDGGDQWKQRRDAIVKTIKTNPKAPYVVRGVVLGSEPLFDNVLPGDGMVKELKSLSSSLKPYTGDSSTDMQVTLSEMPYAYSINSAAKSIFSTVNVVQANVLPFFDQAASTGSAAKSNVQWNLDYLKQNGQGKKILFTQTGWPSNKDVWPGNNGGVVASVDQEKAYFDLLDQNACGFMKDAPNGGVGWFAHIYDDRSLSGWGVLDSNYKLKFSFSPRTSCD